MDRGYRKTNHEDEFQLIVNKNESDFIQFVNGKIMKLFQSFLFFTTANGSPVKGADENLIPLLQLQNECTANCYEIEVITAKDPKSGTDDRIEIQLEGQNGTFSEWFQLDSTSWFYNDFETDLKTTYYAQASFRVK